MTILQSELVKSFDGRITFLRSEFKGMSMRPVGGLLPFATITVWTSSWASGRCFDYDSDMTADLIVRRLQEQL